MKKFMFAGAAAFSCAVLGLSAAEVVETTIAMPTYPYSDPDPVPATGKLYWPYQRYDGSTAVAVTQAWKAVVLENDRIRVTALPGVGGKIWGAFDKVSGHDFVYHNHVVKFRDIATCGPWCSGGIEFNFGVIGHHPMTAAELPYVVRRNADGSVSYIVGNRERICGTVWQVEVRLKDGDDFFTTRTQWFNASPLEQPYYQWMNGAFSARGGDPELVFPASAYIGHDGSAHAWPVDAEGRDLSRYGNNAFGDAKSYHVLTGDERLFAIWWPQWGIGAIHENEWGEKYGRKIFMWALSRAGGIWEDLLTDSDGQYIELQSGRAFNQPQGKTYETPFKHPTFTPGRTDTFVERWGVVRDRAMLADRAAKGAKTERPLKAPADFNWDSAYGHFVRAEQYLRDRVEVAKAKTECDRALVADANFVPARALAAEIAYRQRDYAAVRRHAARALSVDAYNARANYLDALACERLGEADTALERFGLAAYAMEFRSAAYASMARVCRSTGDVADMRRYAGKCLEANPLSIEGLRLGIAAAERLGLKAEVARLTERLREAWPTVSPEEPTEERPVRTGWRGLYDEAVDLAAVGRDAEAAEKLAACGNEPDDWVFYLYRARFRTGAARRADLIAAERHGTDWRIGRDLAADCLAAGDMSEAEKVLLRFLERHPKNNALQCQYARTLLALGRYRECVDYLKDVVILPSEFGGSATATWQEAWRRLGDEKMADSWPENLGQGKPFDKE